ncbi:MAG: sulfotransferase [Ardenticatenaceae bacterium]|nr:sulfotransferase [Ardenticatenaceae bacterium]HBY94955.1 hypothetical protein [Chloroflexota bacterium]
MLPRIFIGGTGRSGTTILYDALGRHEAVYSFPNEMRFLVDPDGLMTLISELSAQYSPVRAREALFRFERLMRVYLTVPQRAPYFGFDLARWLGGEYYWQRLDEFCAQMVEFEFHGRAWQVEPNIESRFDAWTERVRRVRQRMRGAPVIAQRLNLPRKRLRMARYFSDRTELVELARVFVDDLFLRAADQHEKRTWCEKTPQNLFHIGFLYELFPQSVFIHIKRDPRAIIHSMTKKEWVRAPNNVRDSCLFLRAMYDRWFDIKRAVDFNKYCYLELKLEDLAASPHSVLEQVAAFCKLEGRFNTLPDITPDRANYWQKTMTVEDRQLVNEILGAYIERLGYEVYV